MKKKNLLVTAIAIFGLATTTIAQVPSYVPTNGLVGWWPFNGNSNDESGNGNNGTVNGATLTSDRFGNTSSAYSFDGVDDYIEIQLNQSLSYTYSAWVNFNNFTQVNQTVLQHKDNCARGGGPMLCLSNNQLRHLIHNCGQCSPSTCPTELNFTNLFQVNPNQWYNMVITASQVTNEFVVYVNGQQVHSFNSPVSIQQYGVQPLSLGKWHDGVNLFYTNAYKDDVGFWNRALTQQEITDLYNGCQLAVNTQPANQTININNNAQFVVSSSDPGASYQWQTDLGVGFQNLNNVGQYSGTTTNTLNVSNVTMSNNNQPFRCIINSGSCSDTSNVAVLTVNNNVGITETSQDKLFSVFPNPAQSVINVKADSKLIGSVYSIYDNTGRVVLSGKINAESTTIELGNLSGGIYMFTIGENMKQTFKVIKE
jgi:hypothetical protein